MRKQTVKTKFPSGGHCFSRFADMVWAAEFEDVDVLAQNGSESRGRGNTVTPEIVVHLLEFEMAPY